MPAPSRALWLASGPAAARLQAMSIELSPSMEEELRDLAAKRGREVRVLAEEAIRTYLEAAAVTDLDPEQVAEAQLALIGELGALPAWEPQGK